MHMQMAAGITVSTIIYFVGVKSFMDRIGSFYNICHKTIAFFFADIDDFTYMIFVSYDYSSRFALFFKKNQLAYIQITNLNTKLIQQLSSCAVCAICIFHKIKTSCSAFADSFPCIIKQTSSLRKYWRILYKPQIFVHFFSRNRTNS